LATKYQFGEGVAQSSTTARRFIDAGEFVLFFNNFVLFKVDLDPLKYFQFFELLLFFIFFYLFAIILFYLKWI